MTKPIEIDVWQGDIAQLEVDAIVVSANESLFMTAGTAAAVKRRAGEAVEREAVARGPLRPGSVVATTGGRLATPYVIHAVAVGHDLLADLPALERTIAAVLERAEMLAARRIAMPLLGTERGVFVADVVATALIAALARHADDDDHHLEAVVLAASTGAEAAAIRTALTGVGGRTR